jgi:hypothetical protein
MKRARLTVLLLFVLAPGVMHAHEVRPGFLELRETGSASYEVLWKVPARGERRLGLYVGLPGHCRSSEARSSFTAGAWIERWHTRCEGSLIGHQVSIEGLAATRTDVLARVERADGTSQTVRLTPGSPAFIVTAAAGAWDVIWTYTGLGIEHILLGIDHLLFVLALMFLVRDWPRLIGTVTAFTAAHSLTLVAATLGWLHVPQAPVEAAIALSIVFVAAEILNASRGYADLAIRMPWLIAFVFGLLHGLGFAGALSELGLPEQAVVMALAFFNIGVETGQLLFVGGFFLLLWALRPVLAQVAGDTNVWAVAGRLSRPAAYLIGTFASFWLIERVYGFWI